VLSEWATALCHHLQSLRQSQAPLSPTLPRLLGPAVERHLRNLIQHASDIQHRTRRRKLTVEDINFALELHHQESVYGFASKHPLRVAAWDSEEEVAWLREEEVDLTQVVEAPLPPYPLGTSMVLHWMAVNGRQPNIPQNPSKAAVATVAGGKTTGKNTGPGDRRAVEGEAKAMITHVLSREMQLYLERVKAAVRSADSTIQQTVLASLSREPGLQELMPYFSQFVKKEVTENLKKLPLLISLMKMLRGLLSNPYIHAELYLHQLVPAVLTCIVGKKLCSRPTEDHWTLRDLAAHIATTICYRYGSTYTNLQPRITKTLFEAFSDKRKPLTTLYGAIVAISRLGPLCVELLLLPSIEAIQLRLEGVLREQAERKSAITVLEAQHCHAALLNAVAVYLRSRQGKKDPLPSIDRRKRPAPTQPNTACSRSGPSSKRFKVNKGSGSSEEQMSRSQHGGETSTAVEPVGPTGVSSSIFGESLIPFFASARRASWSYLHF